MRRATFERIHCPLCGFSLKAVTVLEENAEFIVDGVFECLCRRYPVVAGILVLSNDNPVGMQQALRFLAAGDRFGALVSLLGLKSISAKILYAACARKIPFAQVSQSLFHMFAAAKARRIIRASTCVQAIEACGLGGYGDYFKTRFVNTSFIAGIALLQVMRDFQGSILELGCGIGHHAFVIAQQFPERPLTLTDHSFMNVFLAKRFFAPQAECICLDLNKPLPFDSCSFQSVFSSDALHYVDAKITAMHEIKRVLNKDYLVVLSHLHNRFGNDPVAGAPLSGEEWRQRAAFSRACLLSEKDIFDGFYHSNRLDLSRDWGKSGNDVNAFSLVASDRNDIFKIYESIGDQYFTLKGLVGINPLFQKISHNSEVCHYRKHWPSAYLRNENACFDAVLPESFVISKEACEAMGRNDGSCFVFEEIQQLIRKFFVIHIPARYC